MALLLVLGCAARTNTAFSADSELTNYKCGIDATWGGVKGTAYQEEYWYHDKLISDTKQVWIRDDTTITFGHNDRNVASLNNNRPKSVIGADGGGQVRYKIDGLWQELRWAPDWQGGGTLYPAYSGPFTLASTGAVGVTGWNGSYWRGLIDSAGDEWHVMMYGDDDSEYSGFPQEDGFDDSWASDGKWVLFCVNPKTPAMTVRASGSGQFYTTPAWTYWVPKIHDQTTYFQGTCTFELNNIYGGDISYRINSGSTVDVGAATVTLDEGDFNDGSNTLEYWYTATPGVKRTRTIVENPAHPGLNESHGDRVWGGSAEWAKFQSRATRAPYSDRIAKAQTENGHGQAAWEGKARQGLRFGGSNWPHQNIHARENAIMAKYLGFNAKASGASKTYAQYAKEMMLESALNQSTVGYETSAWASFPIPCADVVYRGYWDVAVPFTAAIAYDVLMNGYRSDQVAGGITPIEDYFMRDRLADWVHLSALQIGGFAEPYVGMWGTCRNMGATMIACVMPNYSTSYYGTSGMDGNQTVYQWAPFKTTNYTWKEMFVEHSYALGEYGEAPSQIFGLEGSVVSQALIRPPGTPQVWVDKTAYASFGQCGKNIYIYANLIRTYDPGSSHPNLDNYLDQITNGTLYGAKGDTTTPIRQHAITVLNERFPVPAANAGAWVRSLPASDENSDETGVADAGLLGLFWYDDSYTGGPTTPTVSTPVISPESSTGNVSPISVSMTCSTSGATIRYTTDGSDPTSGSPVYSGAFDVTDTMTVKAKAFLSGYNDSGVAANYYSFGEPPLGTPSISPGGGAVPSGTEVAITYDTNSTNRFYRLNGGPWISYAAPLTISATTILEAYSTASGYSDSSVASEIYTVDSTGSDPATVVFAPPVTLDSNSGALGIGAGDLDADGKAEFISISSGEASDDCFQIYDWNGSSWDIYSVLTQAQVQAKRDRFGTQISVADIDHDGDLDIVTTDSGNSTTPGALMWYENPGTLNGGWTEHTASTFSGSGAGNEITHAEQKAADINADGYADVVVRDIGHGSWVFINNKAGGFEARRFLPHNAREGCALADIDQDGDLDIWINGAWWETPGDPVNGTYVLHEPNGVDTNWYPEDNSSLTIDQWACKVETGDFNMDGRIDMVIANAEELTQESSIKPEGIRVYLAPADPVNGTWTEVILRADRAAWHNLQVADFDYDGTPDVISSIGNVGRGGGAPYETNVWLNNGNGTSFTQQQIQNAVAGYQMRLGDADGDGDLDFLMANDYSSNALRYFENTTIVPGEGAQLAEPLISPGGGTVVNGTTVTITYDVASVNTYYRLNGGAWTAYTSPIPISESGTLLEAYSSAAGYAPSPIVNATYTVVNDPLPPAEGSTTEWTNIPLSPSGGNFRVSWKTIFTSGSGNPDVNCVTGLSNGPLNDPSAFGALAVSIRAFSNGEIEARSGSTYKSENTLNYSVGTEYLFEADIAINGSTNTFTLYVTPQGGATVLIALDYSFRTGTTDITTIDNLAFITVNADDSHTVYDIVIGAYGGSGSPTRPSPPQGLTVVE